MFPRVGKAILQHLEGPNGPLTVYVTLSTICTYGMIQHLHPTPKKLDFDLTTHPVSVEEARKLYKKLGSRLRHISQDISVECEKECWEGVKPCSILLRLEKMNGGIKRKRWGSGGERFGGSEGSLDRELRVLEDCDDRRRRAYCDVEDKCEDGCRVGLKPCRVMGELEEMHEGKVEAGWL